MDGLRKEIVFFIIWGIGTMIMFNMFGKCRFRYGEKDYLCWRLGYSCFSWILAWMLLMLSECVYLMTLKSSQHMVLESTVISFSYLYDSDLLLSFEQSRIWGVWGMWVFLEYGMYCDNHQCSQIVVVQFIPKDNLHPI